MHQAALSKHVPSVGPLQGEHAHRVWSAIYDQSCFSNLNDTETCQEQRVFYRLISGECHVPIVTILHVPRPCADFVVLIAARDPGWNVVELS